MDTFEIVDKKSMFTAEKILQIKVATLPDDIEYLFILEQKSIKKMNTTTLEIVETTRIEDTVLCFVYCSRLNCLIIGDMKVKILNAESFYSDFDYQAYKDHELIKS